MLLTYSFYTGRPISSIWEFPNLPQALKRKHVSQPLGPVQKPHAGSTDFWILQIDAYNM